MGGGGGGGRHLRHSGLPPQQLGQLVQRVGRQLQGLHQPHQQLLYLRAAGCSRLHRAFMGQNAMFCGRGSMRV